VTLSDLRLWDEADAVDYTVLSDLCELSDSVVILFSPPLGQLSSISNCCTTAVLLALGYAASVITAEPLGFDDGYVVSFAYRLPDTVVMSK